MTILKKYIILILSIFAFSSTNLNFSTTNVYAGNANIPNISIATDSETGNTSISNGLASTDTAIKGNLLNKILKEYRGIIVFISGIGMLSIIMFMIFNFIELGNSKGNPQARQKAISGLIVSGIATAGLGSVTLIVQLFYNMISADTSK